MNLILPPFLNDKMIDITMFRETNQLMAKPFDQSFYILFRRRIIG